MRRNDREITDPVKFREIIDRCHCCRLGLCDRGRAYVVPLNFGYSLDGSGQYTFYFHGAGEGRKIDLMRTNAWAGFEMDTGFSLMAHLSGREDWSFPDAAVESTCVYRLEVRELACKEHL